MRKFIGVLLAAVMLAAVAAIFKEDLLQGVVIFLIKENPPQKCDALFVLSGGGYDRGNEAVKLLNAKWAPYVVCTGGNPVSELCVMDIDTLESDMTAANLRHHGVPDTQIILLRNGTSTQEEARLALHYCRQRGWNKIMVLTSKLHTRRAARVFHKVFKESGITILMRGAPSSKFNEYEWWKNEDGLIAVNNEWVKTIYYWFKY